MRALSRLKWRPGGVKESGLGREGADVGLEEYLETQYVNLGQLGGE